MSTMRIDSSHDLQASNAPSAIRLRSRCSENLASWMGPKISGPPPVDVDLPALDALDAELTDLLNPLTPKGIFSEIETLRGHYGEWADRSLDLAKRLHRDWIEDLANVPAALITLACQRWRRASDPPHRRAPHTAGELIAQIQPEWGQLKFLAYQAKTARDWLTSQITD